MKLQEITILVDSDAADIYRAASPERRRLLDALLSMRLSELATPVRPLMDVIREASAEGAANGLTEEILREILAEK